MLDVTGATHEPHPRLRKSWLTAVKDLRNVGRSRTGKHPPGSPSSAGPRARDRLPASCCAFPGVNAESFHSPSGLVPISKSRRMRDIVIVENGLDPERGDGR